MADLTNSSWSEADSSNTQPSPNGFPSGMLPGQVGGSSRAIMGATKRFFNRSNVMTTSTGSANAYVLTYAQAPEGYVTGEIYRFFANFTNTAAPTLNINGLGTRPLLRADGSAMAANEIVSGQVVSVVVSGSNFLHQPVGTRYFTDTVSVTTATDAVLVLEDTSAPATTYRQKKIVSSKNVGGGSDWLFRSVRPSDGATLDVTMSASAPGTVWTTGNFNPALKADLAGAVFTGDVTTHRGNTNGVIYLGRQDQNGGRYLFYDGTSYNLPGATTNLAALYVSGAATVNGNTTLGGQLFVRSGRLHVADNNAAGYVSFGNNDQATFGHDSGNFVANGPGTLYVNNIEVTRQNQYHTASGYGFLNHNTYLYADPGQENLVLRTGPPNAYRYSTIDPNGFLTAAGGMRSNGDLFSTGRVIVGEGQGLSYIEMRDTDEGTRYVHNNSGLIGFLGSGGDWIFRVGDGGAVWTKQFGDLNNRIEDRMNNAINARGDRVYKGGDTMTGPLYIDYGYPQLQLTNRDGNGFAYIDFTHVPYGHNDFSWRMAHATGGTNEWQVQYVDNGVRFSVRPDGSLWCAQMGDINGRIEQRAADFANDRLNTATARINNKSARLSYLGDIAVGDVGTSVLWEGYGGGVITGFQQNGNTGYARLFRFRQLQMSDSNGNWYGCGYV